MNRRQLFGLIGLPLAAAFAPIALAVPVPERKRVVHDQFTLTMPSGMPAGQVLTFVKVSPAGKHGWVKVINGYRGSVWSEDTP